MTGDPAAPFSAAPRFAKMDLFSQKEEGFENRPLADRMRPRTLQEYVGQNHLLGEDGLLRRAIAEDRLFSLIFWGPPGCGKTTLARLLAQETKSHFVSFSAVLSGVKEIRAVIEEARQKWRDGRRRTILFVDEIHRFNKAQQDAFLPHVESGLVTLIGATTENPSFEVISPLLSRMRVLTLKPLTEEELAAICLQALRDVERGLGGLGLQIEEAALRHIVWSADGDARAALNSLEAAASCVERKGQEGGLITKAAVEEAIQRKALQYDKAGEEHYNLISALHKSLRGSDPDAALYWLCRMLMAGEDPLYIARRLVRFASEDIGNADPRALAVAVDALQAYHFLGSPEGELALAQAAVYLATSPKSNAVYAAYGRVRSLIEKTGSLPVPLHIRNAPTRLMEELGYGRGYLYAHDFGDAYVAQDYLPEEIRSASLPFYRPSERGYEKIVSERLRLWQEMSRRRGGDPPPGTGPPEEQKTNRGGSGSPPGRKE